MLFFPRSTEENSSDCFHVDCAKSPGCPLLRSLIQQVSPSDSLFLLGGTTYRRDTGISFTYSGFLSGLLSEDGNHASLDVYCCWECDLDVVGNLGGESGGGLCSRVSRHDRSSSASRSSKPPSNKGVTQQCHQSPPHHVGRQGRLFLESCHYRPCID